ncbi:MAG TPA: RIP metalloprotease RseP [Terracidiphilus sp.]|jgi:regulator of sigma E protease|nr:RIP metalloprotease RseP [Terracidiphilus sp.]
MHAFLVSAVAFLVLIGVMVVVHELGHFIAAKLCGVRVEAFSFGFGPRLFGFKYGDTDYKVCLLPLGGFVKMTGEEPGQNIDLPVGRQEVPQNDPGAFTSHPRWQRMLIGVAGPVANFVLAVVLMIFYFGWINEVPTVQVKSTTIEWVTPGSAAAQAGIDSGDIIRRFDSVDNPDWDQVYTHSKVNANQPVAITVDRDGKLLPLTIHIPASAKNDDFDLSDAGILPLLLSGPIPVQQVEPDTPAQRAGLHAGDAIQAADGHPFHNVGTLLAYMQMGQGKPLTLTVLRNGATLSLAATPAKLDDTGWKLGFAVALPPFRDQPLPLGPAVAKAFGFVKDNSTLVLEFLKHLFTHRVSVSQLQGPVGIARMAGDAAEMNGWFPKFDLSTEISLQLGILNLLPFPILDGGMILFLVIESVLRHDINLAIKERIYQAAFVVLMVFFVFIIFSDVSKLPLFSHVKP